MAKGKSIFFCQECGYESSKWMGQCPACHAWNSFVEEAAPSVHKTGGKRLGLRESLPVKLSQVSFDQEQKISTDISEFDRALGGGVVRGSLVLVGGDPGIGKSTLLLQVCRNLAAANEPVLYVSGEESLQQIRMRADRIGSFRQDIQLLCETDLAAIEEAVAGCRPAVLIIDSIQTMYSENVSSGPGSVSQVREATSVLMQLAKREGIAIFIVGHVTKEGVVAGPRVLEHMVDTVLYFEGDRHASYRILRAVKNRFGSTNEIGVFEMQSGGLVQVDNPSEYLLGSRPEHAPGSVISCAVEGTRPLMIEVQALVCSSSFNIPRRTAAGIDYNRINLLMAVLEKRLGLKTASCDAYINLAGGIRLNEPAMDMAVVAAIISSFENAEVPADLLVFGEIGLTGEIRAVSHAQDRLKEAAKLGFRQCCMPETNFLHLQEMQGKRDAQDSLSMEGDIYGVHVTGMRSLRDLYHYICRGKCRDR